MVNLTAKELYANLTPEQKADNRAYAREWLANRTSEQKAVKVAYTREWRANRTPEQKAADADKHRDERRRRKHLIRTNGALNGDVFTLLEIYERDEWVCQICSEPVDPDATGPLGASHDHLIPLTRGGTHTPENIQLAHQSCNSSKGNR